MVWVVMKMISGVVRFGWCCVRFLVNCRLLVLGICMFSSMML